ncbi:hypothetical protein SDC9_152088 [bioreactor metagenome]|uniref:Uncharacterized protein n=1 Tax=bioreactor metagenome TaxID=1076179 RepID=A0A645ETT3_9ZZZZ
MEKPSRNDRWEIAGSLTPELERAPHSHLGGAGSERGPLSDGERNGAGRKKLSRRRKSQKESGED